MCAHHFRFCSLFLRSFRSFMNSKTPFVTLHSMQGIDGKLNDVVFCPSASETENALIYFGGDIQDFRENMKKNSPKYISWSLEDTAQILHEKFPEHSIFVIKASLLTIDKCAVYCNFVESNSKGVPSHKYDTNCVKHLKSLIESTVHSLNLTTRINSLTIIGFSKGCVVLNQLLYCFDYLSQSKDENLLPFVRKIRDIYWLDGGHSGGYNTWITDESLVRSLKTFDIKANIHVTPYQMNDQRRHWIGEEANRFYDLLNQFNVRVNRKMYFEDLQPSINMHFQLLNNFEP